ncbi:MAG: hypothetical protein KDJ29_01775 [Hyphomicrobiales bacterium]|nr:hypothetical protein [Hyphomicrobiales bacterium]
MVRYIIRAIGVVFLASALAALIIDGTRSIAASKVMVTTFGVMASYMFPKGFAALKPAVEQQVHPLLWDPFLVALFWLPAFIVMAVLGLLLIWLARRREVTVGYTSR